ncbi:MAG: amidase [Rhodoferax sp.]|nr:amidase [Rhodoferax sp.]
MKLWQLSASQASQAMAQGTLTSAQYTGACLERIAEREPLVRAWAHVDPELAMAQARRRDQEPRRSAIHGIPIGFKDVIRTRDLPTRHNSPIYANHRPNEDASCVATLRALGAVILGKTETLEFACGGNFPPTRNPLDLERTPGGSSSGSGAAVAAGMVPLTLGTQTGGSTIRPASFCGVYAMKPTLGRIATEGVKAYSVHLDTVGLFGRSVADLRLLANAYRITEQPEAPAVAIGGLRIGLCRTHLWPEADADAQAALEGAARLLRTAGAMVSDFYLSAGFDHINRFQDEIMQDGGRSAFLPEYYQSA